MPRLPAERVREGILHADRDVRQTALRYFTEGFWPDPAVMATAIEAVSRYGRKDTFGLGLDGSDLAQSPETVRWAVDELRDTRKTEGEFYRSGLVRTLVEVDPDLLAPVADDLLAAGVKPDAAARVRRRLALRAKTGDELWAELEALCAAHATLAEGVRFPWEHGYDLVAALGKQGDRHVPRVMELLPHQAADDDDDAFYREALLTRLAGELRHEPAVPLILAKFEADSDYLNEESQRALSRIGSDTVAAATLQAYREDENDNRIYLGSVLGSIRSDAGVAASLAAAAGEEEDWLKCAMVANLVQQLATEANDFARDYLKDGDDFEVLPVLVSACTLTGQDYPELPAWRKALATPARQSFHVPEPAPPPRGPAPLMRDEARVGRNDPCPCGSGKKFKKCCRPTGGDGGAGW